MFTTFDDPWKWYDEVQSYFGSAKRPLYYVAPKNKRLDSMKTEDNMELTRYINENIGKPGHNEYGVPLHACNGHRPDEHWWKWLEAKRLANESQHPQSN